MEKVPKFNGMGEGQELLEYFWRVNCMKDGIEQNIKYLRVSFLANNFTLCDVYHLYKILHSKNACA